jgi:Tol biopolymer transport system component/DNA-binding winged helix-turn-helix (wHTH) protein
MLDPRMTPLTRGPALVRFEEFEANLRTDELFRSGRKVRLPNQSFRILATLLERPGELVSREELRARLWRDGTHVEFDRGLNAAMTRLREALRDSADAPRFIETLHKRGYRFIATVQTEAPPRTVARSVSAEPGGIEYPTSPVSHCETEVPGAGPRTGSMTRGPYEIVRGRRALLLAAAGMVSAALLIAAAVWLFAHPAATGSVSGRTVLPFTSLPGLAIAPTFSPDGSQIAFAWNAGAADQFDLYVKTLGSERLLRLTHHPSKWISPAWSPDGSRIAFVRETDEGAGLFVVPALGGPERRIVGVGVSIEPYKQVSWSPDGRLLAYSAYAPIVSNPHVYLVPLDSLNPQLLAPAPECVAAGEPAFSPDGKELALVCSLSAAVHAIYVVELPHGPMRRLASMMGNPRGLTWAPDGSRLVLANDPGDGGELWEVSLKGQLTQLPFGEQGSAPAVASRGGRIAYVRGRTTLDIWRADLTTPHPEASAAKLIYSTLSQVRPRYSPDGGRIAFQSNRSGRMEIWTTDAQGADPDPLTSFGGPLTAAPSWCSDGRRIAFDSRASGTSDIYIEDIAERVPRKVITSHPNLSSPVWSRDCRWLFAIDGNGRLYRLPSSGGQAEPFAERPASFSAVLGEQVVFNRLVPGGFVLLTKAVNGGPEVPIANMPQLGFTDECVPTPAGIYFTDHSTRPISLNFYEFASRTTRKVMTLDHSPVPGGGPGLEVSPDGHWLLYSQVDDEQSEIMLAPGL